MGLTPICVKCGREMSCAKNGVVVYHPFKHATPGPVQESKVGGFKVVYTDRMIEGSWKEGDIDFVAIGDKYKCPDCGFEVVVDCGGLYVAFQQRQDFLKGMVTEAEEVIEIRRGK